MSESRCFVIQIKTDDKGARSPMHLDSYDIEGFSGQIYNFDEEMYSSLPFSGKEMYVARVYGAPDILDNLEYETGVYGKKEYGLSDEDIAKFLNDRFDQDRSFNQWMDKFKVS